MDGSCHQHIIVVIVIVIVIVLVAVVVPKEVVVRIVNAIVIVNSGQLRCPFIIDPAQGATAWLQRHLGDDKANADAEGLAAEIANLESSIAQMEADCLQARSLLSAT